MSFNNIDYDIQKLSGINTYINAAEHDTECELSESVQVVKWFVPQVDGAHFTSKEAFNVAINRFMKDKINATKPRNDVLSISCDSTMRCAKYIDIDHYNGNVDEAINSVVNICQSIMRKQAYYLLTFKPAVEPIDGAHLYLIYNVELTDEQDKQFVNKFNEALGEAFDPLPWKSPVMNLPFCHKSFEKRDYLLQLNQCIPNTKTALIDAIDSIEFISDSKTMDEMNVDYEFSNADGVELDDFDLKLIANSFEAFDSIHRTQNKSFNEKVALMPIIEFINGIKNNDSLITSLRNCSKLSPNARDAFNTILIECRKTCSVNVYISLVKLQAKQFYSQNENNFKSLIQAMSAKIVDELISEYETNKTTKLKTVTLPEIWRCENIDDKLKLLKTSIRYLYNQRVFISRVESEKAQLMNEEELRKCFRSWRISKTEDKNYVLDGLSTNVMITTIETEFDALFNGWHWNEKVKSVNYENNVKQFKDIFLFNTFNNDEPVFDYYLKRTSFILHNPGKLSKVMFWFIGLMGTGKNTFTDLITDIFRNHSNGNLDLSKALQKHNTSTYGLCYGDCNEVIDSENNKDIYKITEELKKIIERSTKEYEPKGVNPWTGPNTINLDATSNNLKPLHLTIDDRRHVILQANNEHADDKEYWDNYYDNIYNDEFINDVFSYIWNECYDEKFLKLPIPMTETKLNIIKLCANAVVKFMVKNIGKFIIGLTEKEISSLAVGNTGSYSSDRFVIEVKKYCKTRYDNHRKTNIFYIDEDSKWFERFSMLEEDEEEEEKNEEEEIEDKVSDRVAEMKKEHGNNYYVLASLIPKDEKQLFKDWFETNGWTFKKSKYKNETRDKYIYIIDKDRYVAITNVEVKGEEIVSDEPDTEPEIEM